MWMRGRACACMRARLLTGLCVEITARKIALVTDIGFMRLWLSLLYVYFTGATEGVLFIEIRLPERMKGYLNVCFVSCTDIVLRRSIAFPSRRPCLAVSEVHHTAIN